jgi:enoyl-CoA hydratase/carnithine racemase
MEYQQLIYEEEKDVARITLNRPEVYNALSRDKREPAITVIEGNKDEGR